MTNICWGICFLGKIGRFICWCERLIKFWSRFFWILVSCCFGSSVCSNFGVFLFESAGLSAWETKKGTSESLSNPFICASSGNTTGIGLRLISRNINSEVLFWISSFVFTCKWGFGVDLFDIVWFLNLYLQASWIARIGHIAIHNSRGSQWILERISKWTNVIETDKIFPLYLLMPGLFVTVWSILFIRDFMQFFNLAKLLLKLFFPYAETKKLTYLVTEFFSRGHLSLYINFLEISK